MIRFAIPLLIACLLLIPAAVAHPAGNTISLGELKAPTMEVTAITPQLEQPDTLRLTAELNAPPQEGCPVTWRFKGPSHGYVFESTEGTSVLLFIGEEQSRVTVEACLSCGGNQGGCAALALESEVLEKAEDVKKFGERHKQDFAEDRFLCEHLGDDQYQYVFYDVASRVNTVTGEYSRDKEDLAVKVPGGRLSVHRWYQGGRWTWDHERHDLTVVWGPEGAIASVKKGEVPYRPVPGEEGVFTDGTYRIGKTDPGFRWESRHGEWKRYNPEGRLIAFGDRTGVIGRVLFRDGHPYCLSDRNNRAVLWMEYDEAGLLRTAYDLTGRGVTYRYRSGRLSAATDVLGKETRFAYDAEGRLSEVLEPEGQETRIAYDAFGHVASVLDAQGKGHTFLWDYDQDVSLYYVCIEDPAGKVTEIWSNQKGQARRVDVNHRTVHRIEKQGNTLVVTDARGLVTKKTFDERGNLTDILYPDGSAVRTEYEPRFNRPVKKINENEVETHYAYDENGNRIRMKEAVGTPSERVTEYAYDPDGNLLSTRLKGDAKTPEAVTTHTYDAFGNHTSTTDPEGHTTRFTYDAQGNLLTKTDPTGSVWRYAYDTAGRMIASTDPLGHETRYFYDAEGRRVREIDPMGNETRFAYDAQGNRIAQTDALGNTTRFEYNISGLPTRKIDPEGKETRFAYDAQGRLVSQKDGAGNETRMEYDTPAIPGCPSCNTGSANKPSRIVFPTYTKAFTYDARGRKIEETKVVSETESYTTFFDYDPAGNRISVTDAAGRTTSHAYDALNRLIRMIDPLGNETAYTYDDRDNLVALTDANGNTTRFAYDWNDRLVRETRPMGEETTYAYDGAGNLVEKVDAKGQRAAYTHDPAGRLVKIEYFTAQDPDSPVKTVSFAHDAAGNLVSYADGTTSGRYAYDALNRKTEETVDYGPFTKSFSYAYYANGRKKSFTGPDGIPYTYTYDQANRLASIEAPALGTIEYADYQWHRPRQVSYPGGTKRSFAYDPLMRTQRITSTAPDGDVIMDYRYTYGPAGNITTKQTEHGEYRYRYDALDQLVAAENPTLPDEAYTYDPVGNRLTSAHVQGPWTYNENNELLHYDDVSFTYDANGSTVEKATPTGVSRYVYNVENRMARVENGAGTLIARYYYDPFGRRLWKEVEGRKTYFLYSDEGLVGEYNDNGGITKTYTYIPESSWTKDPLSMTLENLHCFYHNDHLGTPQKITSKKGNVFWSGKSYSFGKTKIEFHKFTNKLRFPGHYYETECNLNYNYFRYYDYSRGIYLSVDPFGFIMICKAYGYSTNNPLIFIDPYGLIWVTIDYDYYGINNWLKWWWNRWITQIGKGMELTMPGADPKEYEGLERDVIQQWHCDPDNYDRNMEHTIGTLRKITQTYKKHPPLKNGETIIKSTHSHYWEPQVPSPTYNNFPGSKIVDYHN